MFADTKLPTLLLQIWINFKMSYENVNIGVCYITDVKVKDHN